MKTKSQVNCCICGKEINWKDSCNPDPIIQSEEARCCHDCDRRYVIPARRDPSLIHDIMGEIGYFYWGMT